MRRMIVVTCGLAVSACGLDSVPQLTERDLKYAMAMSVLGRTPSNQEILLVTTPDEHRCIDLRHPKSTFASDAKLMTNWDRWKIRLGIGPRHSGWEFIRGPEQVAPAEKLDFRLGHRLQQAENVALLSIASSSALEVPAWPKSCETKLWFQKPVYSSNFAFIERGETCGALCGHGTMLALEYRNGHWAVVAERPTWIA